MKSISRALLMVLAIEGQAATDLIDTAQVVSSTPIVEHVTEPRQECDPAPSQQCRTVQATREVIKGYTVVYRYNGRDVTTTLPRDPGPTVRVGVGVFIDDGPAAKAPTASMMGTNVRDVTPAEKKPAPAAPAPAGNTGGYQYRY